MQSRRKQEFQRKGFNSSKILRFHWTYLHIVVSYYTTANPPSQDLAMRYPKNL